MYLPPPSSFSSQICLLPHADRYGAKLCPHTEELPRHTHGGETHQVDTPPGEGARQGHVPPQAGHQVQQVSCAAEVQAQLGPLHDEPKGQGAGEGVEYEGGQKELARGVGGLQLLVAEHLGQAAGGGGQQVQHQDPGP